MTTVNRRVAHVVISVDHAGFALNPTHFARPVHTMELKHGDSVVYRGTFGDCCTFLSQLMLECPTLDSREFTVS